LLPVGQQWRMIMHFAAEHKLNWRHNKLRQKTCIDESLMLSFLATLRIVYWQSAPAAQQHRSCPKLPRRKAR
jgi:hypothetical protein